MKNYLSKLLFASTLLLSATSYGQKKSAIVDPIPIIEPSVLPQYDINTSNVVGFTKAIYDCNPVGDAEYHVPITIPDGLHDLKPDLAINYNSNMGLGLLGINWNLSGISKITRTSKELHYDASISGVNLNEGELGDRFLLDGQRLILASGTYGASGSTYRLENDNQTKISCYFKTGLASISAYFIVENPDGKIYEYGSNAQSKIVLDVPNSNNVTVQKNLSWYINRIYDRNLNVIEYFYTTESQSNELLISAIKYTGSLDQSEFPDFEDDQNRGASNNIAALSGNFSVNFEYVSYGTIYNPTYVFGSMFNKTKFIKQINIKAGTAIIKSYIFDYTTSLTNSTSHVRLLKIQETDGGNGMLHPIHINWNNNSTAITESVSDGANRIIKNLFIMISDVNADGISDVISSKSPSNTSTMEATVHFGKPENQIITAPNITSVLNAKYQYYTQKPNEGIAHQFLDFDDDGISDILLEQATNVTQGARVFSVHYSTGKQIATSNPQLFTVQWSAFYVGAGQLKNKYFKTLPEVADDILVFDRNVDQSIGGHSWRVHINGLKNITTQGLITESYNNIKSCNIVDLNNDGISEFIIVNDLQNGTDMVAVYSFDEDIPNYKFTLKKQFTISSSYNRIYFSDFNGDGLADFLTHNSSFAAWDYYVNNGTYAIGNKNTVLFNVINGINIPFNINQPNTSRIYIQDFNGDGAKDLGVLNNNASSADFYVGSLKDITQTNKSLSVIINYKASSNSTVDLDFCGVGDFNGDKQSDLLVYVNTLQRFKYIYIHADKLSSELVKSIVDSERKRISFVYSSFQKATYNLFAQDQNSALRKTSPPKYFLSKILVDDKTELLDKLEFDFQIPAWNRYGKGLLGFRIEIRLENNIITNQSKEYIKSAALLAPGTIKQYTSVSNTLVQGVLLNEAVHKVQIANPVAKLNMVNITKVEIKDYVKNTSTRDTSTFNTFGSPLTRSTFYYQKADFTSASFYKRTDLLYTYLHIPSIYLDKLSVLEEKNTIKTNPTETEKCSLIYSSKGLLSQKLNYVNNQLITTNSFVYDNRGRVLSIAETNASNNATRVETINNYDITGRYPKKVTNPAGLFIINEEHDVWGNVKKRIDYNGLVTKNYFNNFGNIIKTELPLPNHEINYNYKWQNTYTDSKLYSIEVTQTSKPTKITYFDILGRKTTEGVHNINNMYTFVKYTYDNLLNRISSTSEPFLATQTASLFTTYEYILSGMHYGKLFKIISPRAIIEYSYNGNSVTEKETSVSPNKITTKTYNIDGTLASVENSLGEKLEYTYFLNSKVKNITTAGIISNTYVYDSRGFLQSEISANHGTIQYVYNNFGEITSKTDARGNVFNYTYDNLGRLLTKSNFSQGTISYTYDNATNAKGRLVSVNNNINSQANNFVYDTYGRLISNEYVFENTSFTKQYEYSEDGTLRTMTYPNNFKLFYGYSPNGYLNAVYDYNTGNKIWLGISRNLRLQITEAEFGNDLPDNREYDHLGRLTRINMGAALDITYDFDDNTGNLTSKTYNLNNFTENYFYDNLDRLISVENNYNMPTQSLMYGNNGNIISKSDLGNYKYSASKINAVEKIHDFSSAIPSFQQDVVYNEINKPVFISENNKTIELEYGLYENRIKTTTIINGEVKMKFSFGDYEVVDIDGKKVEKCYIYCPTGLIAVHTKVVYKNMSNIQFVHKDHLGSIMAFSDINQTVINRRKYDAWGRLQNPENGSYNDIPVFDVTDFGYTGHEHYQDFGIINMNGRIYDPAMGRFFSPDPFIQDPENLQSFNQYSYVYNNPLKYTDPSGYLSTAYYMDGVRIESYDVPISLEGSGVIARNGNVSFAQFIYPTNGGYVTSWSYKAIRDFYDKSDYPLFVNTFPKMNGETDGFNGNTYVSRNKDVTIPGARVNDGGSIIDLALKWSGITNDIIDASGKVSMVATSSSIARYTVPTGIAIGAAQIGRGYYKDGKRYGYNTQKATASFVGGIAGAWAGFEAGATIGFEGGFVIGATFAGVGAIPGAVIGGIVGGFGGAFGGAYYGSQLGEGFITNKVR